MGHWGVIDLRTDDYPGGIQATLYEKLLQKADSGHIKLDKKDSADLEQKSKRFFKDELGNLYFQFNPDGSCVMSFEKGKIARGSYKVKENANTLIFTLNKN